MDEHKKSKIVSTAIPAVMFEFLKKRSSQNDITVSQLLRLAVRRMYPGENF